MQRETVRLYYLYVAILTESNLYYIDYLPRIKDYYYFDIYIKFINQALERWDMPDGLTEKHHVVPKCYLPNWMTVEETFKRNMVVLTSHEHYIAHYYLARALGGKMEAAFKRMSYNSKYNTAVFPADECVSDFLR